jgi:hypothetical protein
MADSSARQLRLAELERLKLKAECDATLAAHELTIAELRAELDDLAVRVGHAGRAVVQRPRPGAAHC